MNPVICHNYQDFFDKINIHKHKHISFHHHLRNGDFVINQVLGYYEQEHVQDIHLHPSSIFPTYTKILDLIKHNQITHITTNYVNGPVAEYISENGLIGQLTMQTHGGRARSIIDKRDRIDIAYIAAPTVDKNGNAIGYDGPSKCGSLGYAIADAEHASITVLITDNLIDSFIESPEISGTFVDYIIVVDQIGNPKGIVSGTTNITTDPIGVKIARLASSFLDECGMIKPGFSYQSGAGGTSLRVTKEIRDIMINKHIKASFFSGGITQYHVQMLEEGLVERLYDVQCFDLEAVRSIKANKNHIPISASQYANPMDQTQVISNLDIVILGATEVDLDFNVNVTTDSHQTIIGGSGGHSDTATEASCTIIVSPLIKARIPLIRDRVTTITTKGEHVDVLVTERGIAIHPNRKDLWEKMAFSTLPIMTIKELQQEAYKLTGKPQYNKQDRIQIGIVEDRDYTVNDYLYKKK